MDYILSLFQLDVLFGNLTEMVEFQVEFLKTLEDGVRLVPDLEKLERVDQFKVSRPECGLPRGPGRTSPRRHCCGFLCAPAWASLGCHGALPLGTGAGAPCWSD